MLLQQSRSTKCPLKSRPYSHHLLPFLSKLLEKAVLSTFLISCLRIIIIHQFDTAKSPTVHCSVWAFQGKHKVGLNHSSLDAQHVFAGTSVLILSPLHWCTSWPFKIIGQWRVDRRQLGGRWGVGSGNDVRLDSSLDPTGSGSGCTDTTTALH